MEVQQFIKSDRRKNDNADRLCRMPAKVISYPYTCILADQVDFDSGQGQSYDDGKSAMVTWEEVGETHTELVKMPTAISTNNDIYVVTDRSTFDRFLIDEEEDVEKYQQIYVYNGVEVDVDNQKYVRVKLLGGEEDELVFPNKTGVLLSYGDSVWVYYWKDISSGYISLDNTDDTNITFILKRLNNVEIGSVEFNIISESSTFLRQTVSYKKKHFSPRIFTQIRCASEGTMPNYPKMATITKTIRNSTTQKETGFKLQLYAIGDSIPQQRWFVDYLVIDI